MFIKKNLLVVEIEGSRLIENKVFFIIILSQNQLLLVNPSLNLGIGHMQSK